MKQDFETRFWNMVDRRGDDECWLWRGYKKDGYGMTNWNGRPVFAHRVAYMLTRGPIPHGALLLHSCDVRGCTNPNHLRPGTHAENGRDARERFRMACGERNRGGKL